jgi:hypothetical protein
LIVSVPGTYELVVAISESEALPALEGGGVCEAVGCVVGVCTGEAVGTAVGVGLFAVGVGVLKVGEDVAGGAAVRVGPADGTVDGTALGTLEAVAVGSAEARAVGLVEGFELAVGEDGDCVDPGCAVEIIGGAENPPPVHAARATTAKTTRSRTATANVILPKGREGRSCLA